MHHSGLVFYEPVYDLSKGKDLTEGSDHGYRAQPAAGSVPLMPPPPYVAPTPDFDFSVGDHVECFSKKAGKWIPAIILDVRSTNTYDLDCKFRAVRRSIRKLQTGSLEFPEYASVHLVKGSNQDRTYYHNTTAMKVMKLKA